MIDTINKNSAYVKKALRSAYRDATDIKSLSSALFRHGFPALNDKLEALNNKGTPSVRKQRRACFTYLQNHQDEILPLRERELSFTNLCSMGCMESNTGKTIALRMKTRGCSWSRAGAESMSAILCHLTELQAHTFRYNSYRSVRIEAANRPGKKPKFYEESVHKASFPIYKAGKASEPFFELLKGIMYE